jgi:cytochrome P450
LHHGKFRSLTEDLVPGPKLAAATDLCYCYYLIRGEEVSWISECHERYGEVFRYGPGKLSYITPQAWKDIAGHRTGGRAEFQKDSKMYRRDANGEYNMTTEPTTQSHSQVRKVFTSAFSDKALKLQEPLIFNYVDKLRRNIDEAVAADPEIHLDAVKLYNCTTFDIMGDLTFGEPLGMLDTGEYTQWVRTVFEGMKVGTMLGVTLHYPLLGLLLKMFMPPSLRGKDLEHFQHSADRVDKRLEKGTDIGKSDIWKLVLENQKIRLTLSKMHSNASNFMIAGTETTATLLSGFTYLLLSNPDKLKKVVTEVRALPKEDLSLEVLPRLQYLNACFQEALRCYPPVPIGLPREVPQGGATICGEWVPEKVKANHMWTHSYF